MSVGVFIGIVYIKQMIACQKFGGYMLVGVFIYIVYFMATIGGISVSYLVSLVLEVCGPIGPWVGGCNSFGVYMGIVYTMTPI